MGRTAAPGRDARIEAFLEAWSGLRRAVDALPAEAFAHASGCRGWLVRDLVCHLVIDVQDVLITLATPAGTSTGARGVPPAGTSAATPAGTSGATSADAEPQRRVDAAGYWSIVDPPTGDDPLDALISRLAAAYEDPALLSFHLDDLGSAAARAVRDAEPDRLVETQGMVLSTGDFADAYVLEWTLHHLDLAQGAPGIPGPSAASLARARELLIRVIAGSGDAPLIEVPDADLLRILTGRLAPSAEELAALPPRIAQGLPYPVG
ncbi:maleylpyruvate isomerase N-terminal domain-containing protein [Brachybacterium sp. ACRRE]|uniref:maleylpyruvate isomerase N-terminal domain-containing protein n=1 Tax=Brachybacterium sp. ACRRE TaxID=2918184 RepID=UPI001EF30F0A|nr:maleylpyruvate isomerase N-terminal domain-containing protein [Brachybacterium sp. ACRRE]MCG7311236.1 maleylpyruvate isomerase N-terminal domain-containing protein [Brachybacterium sp. ACRRE]